MIIGAINIDIRQYGYHRNSNDDTYIALRDIDTGEYILNGDFVMSMFRKTIQYGGTTLEYSVLFVGYTINIQRMHLTF